MTQKKTKNKPSHSLIKKLGLIFVGLFLLYVIAGFWVVPPLLKPRLEKELSSQIGRKVTIEEIILNPLALSATTINLTVYEINEEPFAGFKELLVDAQLSSILKWAVTFKAIRITEPFGVLKVLPDRTLNISDIIAKFTQSEPAPREQSELPRAVISKLQVEDGKFTVEDLSGTEPISETLSPITFSLTDLSTLAEREGAFKITAADPKGGDYQLDGQVSVNPIRVQGSYSATATNLSQLWRHIEDQVSFQIKSGTTAASGSYLLELSDDTLNAKLQNGIFELKDFQLTEKGQDTVLISVPSFTVQGISADVATREIVVEQVKTAGARIESWLAPDGTLNLQSLFMPDLNKLPKEKKSGSAEPGPSSGNPWQATIKKIEVDDWGAAIEDRTLPEPVRFTVDGLTVRIENLANKQNSKARVGLALQIKEVGTVKVDGFIGIEPLSADLEVLTDKFALKPFQPYVDMAVNAGIVSGIASSKGRIIYQSKDGTPHINFQNGVFELKDFQLTEKGKDKVLVSIPSFTVQGISADIAAREIVVEQVNTADGRIEFWIAPDGTVNLQNLIIPDSQKSMEDKKSGSTEPQPADSSPWHATIHKIEVDKWGAAIEDRTLPKPVRITVDDLTASIEDLATKKNSKAKVAFTLQINRAGTVKVDGSAGITPLSADLTVLADKIALKSFQPYVDTAVKAHIESGTTSSKGRVLYRGKDGQPQISYQGELSLDGIEIKDRSQSKDFISQKQIKASGIVLDLHPNKLQVADVLIDKTHARVTIDQNGTVNVVQAFTPIPKKGAKGKENLIERVVKFLILQVKGPLPMSIDRVRLNNFAVDLIDGSIKPPYKTYLEITEGTMKGMSSDPAARADFKIDGTIDQSATIKSTGQMNPLNAMQYAKVDFSLNDFKLKPVSPYSAKYVGYKIADGTLNLKLKYRVDNNKFTGDNQFVVVGLDLGDKVGSPAATDLPVVLFVTMLKGGDGRITLQVPVSGDINDPHFDFGQTILSALTGAMKDFDSPPASDSTDGSQSSATADSSQSSSTADSSQSSSAAERSQSSSTADSSQSSSAAERSQSSSAADSSQPSSTADSSQTATTTGSSPSSTTSDIEPIKGEELRFIDFEFGLAELSARAMKKLDMLAKFLNKTPALALGIESTAVRQMDRAEMSGKQNKKEMTGSNQKADRAQQKDPAMDQTIEDNQLKMLAQMRAEKVKNYLIQIGNVAAKRVRLKAAKITSPTDKSHGRVELYLSMH
jgi:outer membrane protein OmpA-like peptidoglycan-associated protein